MTSDTTTVNRHHRPTFAMHPNDNGVWKILIDGVDIVNCVTDLHINFAERFPHPPIVSITIVPEKLELSHPDAVIEAVRAVLDEPEATGGQE